MKFLRLLVKMEDVNKKKGVSGGFIKGAKGPKSGFFVVFRGLRELPLKGLKKA